MRIKLDEFVAGYIECALWCGLMIYRCEHGENAYDCSDCDPDEIEPELENADYDADADDLTDAVRAEIERECRDFVASNIFDLMACTLDSSQCGHDFYLTRNRHGAGFWDRKHISKVADAALDRLTNASHVYGEQSFILNRDGKVETL